MTIWNVSHVYNKKDKINYIVLPYNLKGTILVHLKYYNVIKLFKFLKNSRLTEKSAIKYANIKNKQYEKEGQYEKINRRKDKKN